MSTAEHVTYEANLIARNLECLGQRGAVAAAADHMRRFWAPLLRTEAVGQVREHPERFSPIAREAISQLHPAGGPG